MARTKDVGAQEVINFVNSMFRDARKRGFSGRKLRQASKIFASMADAVPDGEVAKLSDFDEDQATGGPTL